MKILINLLNHIVTLSWDKKLRKKRKRLTTSNLPARRRSRNQRDSRISVAMIGVVALKFLAKAAPQDLHLEDQNRALMLKSPKINQNWNLKAEFQKISRCHPLNQIFQEKEQFYNRRSKMMKKQLSSFKIRAFLHILLTTFLMMAQIQNTSKEAKNRSCKIQNKKSLPKETHKSPKIPSLPIWASTTKKLQPKLKIKKSLKRKSSKNHPLPTSRSPFLTPSSKTVKLWKPLADQQWSTPRIAHKNQWDKKMVSWVDARIISNMLIN